MRYILVLLDKAGKVRPGLRAAASIAAALVLGAFAVGASPIHAAASDPDWRVFGFTDEHVLLYSVPDIVREPDNLVRVWSEQLNSKAVGRVVNRATGKGGNVRFMAAVIGRVARYYEPPLMLAGLDKSCNSSKRKDCLAERAADITSMEEVANESLVPRDGLVLYELDCREKRARVLSVIVYQKHGSPESSSRPMDWEYVPPETNLDWLLTIVCDPSVAAVDNTPCRGPVGKCKLP